MPHYSVPAGQALVIGWCITLLIGWLALRWLAMERGVASRALLLVGARLGRGVRLVIVACGAVCLWAGPYFALTPHTFGGYHPNWAALALVPRRVAVTAPFPPLEGEAWPY